MQLHFWREMVCYKLNKNVKKLKKNFDHIVDMKIQTENLELYLNNKKDIQKTLNSKCVKVDYILGTFDRGCILPKNSLELYAVAYISPIFVGHVRAYTYENIKIMR